MFGKKGGVLSSWIKEFCTLVFIQTIQAFIYAIIITLILNLEFGAIEKVEDRNGGIAILAIIALTSVFKIEEMVKKIFGIQQSRADVRGAMSSLAKTAIAWQFGKKVLDNGAKVAGGIKARQDAAKGRQKLKSRMQRDMLISEGYVPSDTNKYTPDQQSYMRETSSNDSPNNNNNTASSGTKRSTKEIRDYNAMMDKYQDQLDELKKKRREGTKQILQGLGETAGAVPGMLSGAIIGGADGNLDEALRGAAVGMGMGDTIGGAVAGTAYDVGSTISGIPQRASDLGATISKINKAVKEQNIDSKGLAKARDIATAYYKQATKNRVSEREIQDIIKKANDANADNAN